jgi:hypothetical protein
MTSLDGSAVAQHEDVRARGETDPPKFLSVPIFSEALYFCPNVRFSDERKNKHLRAQEICEVRILLAEPLLNKNSTTVRFVAKADIVD